MSLTSRVTAALERLNPWISATNVTKAAKAVTQVLAFYQSLRERLEAILASLLDEAVTPFTDLVDWQQKDDRQRQMRSRIKRQLRAGGIDTEAVESLAADIVDLAKVRTDR